MKVYLKIYSSTVFFQKLEAYGIVFPEFFRVVTFSFYLWASDLSSRICIHLKRIFANTYYWLSQTYHRSSSQKFYKISVKKFSKINKNTCFAVSGLFAVKTCNFIKERSPTQANSCEFLSLVHMKEKMVLSCLKVQQNSFKPLKQSMFTFTTKTF